MFDFVFFFSHFSFYFSDLLLRQRQLCLQSFVLVLSLLDFTFHFEALLVSILNLFFQHLFFFFHELQCHHLFLSFWSWRWYLIFEAHDIFIQLLFLFIYGFNLWLLLIPLIFKFHKFFFDALHFPESFFKLLIFDKHWFWLFLNYLLLLGIVGIDHLGDLLKVLHYLLGFLSLLLYLRL